MKKKDKKKLKRTNIKLRNIRTDSIDDLYEETNIPINKTVKKNLDRTEKSLKNKTQLVKGQIIEIMTNNYSRVEIEDRIVEIPLSGRIKQLKSGMRNILAVGDYVNVDVSETLRIEEILPYKNKLSRFMKGKFHKEIIMATNIDQIIITASYRNPELKLGLIDRYLCIAEINNIKPIICINKIDLADSIEKVREELKFYFDLGYEVVLTSAEKEINLDLLRDLLKEKDSVFTGHSGAGKSSLINKLQSGILQKIGDISTVNKGQHTTSSSLMIKWKFGGHLIDTPGIKILGLDSENKDKISKAFPGFKSLFPGCKFKNCTHTHEIGCNVKATVEANKFDAKRYESYLRIRESLE